jgi:hypothetical protein
MTRNCPCASVHHVLDCLTGGVVRALIRDAYNLNVAGSSPVTCAPCRCSTVAVRQRLFRVANLRGRLISPGIIWYHSHGPSVTPCPVSSQRLRTNGSCKTQLAVNQCPARDVPILRPRLVRGMSLIVIRRWARPQRRSVQTRVQLPPSPPFRGCLLVSIFCFSNLRAQRSCISSLLPHFMVN